MPNRLAQAQSLYLRKHAENPIDWWPWCEAALTKAAAEDKPIFLSVGYSSCHWCTVMEGEAFSDKAIAAYMNAHFVPIKVDREERPDLDNVYMQALQMMVGQGGWPLNLFLAPTDRVPFYGGTYFPVEPRYGRSGFLQVLQAIRNFYDTEKTKLDTVKTDILGALKQAAELPPDANLSRELLQTGLGAIARLLEPAAQGNSFPMMPYALATLRSMRFTLESVAHPVCLQRGIDLATGGIYDHVGGGFHRYTVDPTWTVPHFEKMLYDNGQIVEYLAQLWRSGERDLAFERAIAGTVNWLQREMTAPAGFFYAAQDADSFVTPDDLEPEEGAFYGWAYAELKTLLTADELAALTTAFDITPQGNFEGNIVLQRLQPGLLSEGVEAVLDKLFACRYGSDRSALATFPPARDNHAAKTQPWLGRIPAVTDTKMIVAWNSLMISGLAQAAIALEQPDYLAIATRATQFILNHQWVDGRLSRLNYDGQPAVLAQADDYALFIKALIDLQQASLALGDPDAAQTWLTHAIAVQREFDQWLWHTDLGGYTTTAKDVSDRPLVQERPYQDSAVPSANGVASANLIQLALLTEDLTYLDRAEQILHAFGQVMGQMPRACPSLFTALDWFYYATLVRTTADRVPVLLKQYLPAAVCQVMAAIPKDTVGLVCQALSCQAPATNDAELAAQLRESLLRH